MSGTELSKSLEKSEFSALISEFVEEDSLSFNTASVRESNEYLRMFTEAPDIESQRKIYKIGYLVDKLYSDDKSGCDDLSSVLNLIQILRSSFQLSKDGAKKSALELAENFLTSHEEGSFPGLNRVKIAYGLTLRIVSPSRIDQGRSGLCGPAAFASYLARHRVYAYARFITELAESGSAGISGFHFKASDKYKRELRPVSSLQEADLLILTALVGGEVPPEGRKALANFRGTSLDSVFDLMVETGHSKVNLVRFPMKFCLKKGLKFNTALSMVNLVDLFSDKSFFAYKHSKNKRVKMVSPVTPAGALKRMLEDLSAGFRVVMLTDLQLADAISGWHNHLKSGYYFALYEQTATGQLGVMKEASLHAAKEIRKKMLDTSPQPHFVLVHGLSEDRGQLSLKISHHGSFHEGRQIPLDLFLQRVHGFVSFRL